MRNVSLFFAIVLICPVLIGCGGGAPSDFPRTFPVTVTVMNGATAISDAEVFFTPEGGGDLGRFTIRGTTNASGAATIRTIAQNHSANGAPEGTFLVYVVKEPEAPPERPQEELDLMDAREREAYDRQRARELQALPREVPTKFSRPNTSGLRITVEPGRGGTLNVDVSQN